MNARVTNLTGLQGGVVITDTNAHTPATPNTAFHAIVVLQQAVIAAIASNLTNDSALVALTLPAGTIIYGRITSITLTSGVVIAYNEL
jgi:hypothetical protein